MTEAQQARQLEAVRLWLASPQPDRAKVAGIRQALASPEYVSLLLDSPDPHLGDPSDRLTVDGYAWTGDAWVATTKPPLDAKRASTLSPGRGPLGGDS